VASYGSPVDQPRQPGRAAVDADEPDEPDEDDAPELPSHATRLAWYEEWEEQQRDNRIEQRLDRDYYDGNQLSDEVLKALKERGQPPTVNNLIAKKVNTLLGEEIEKRFDPSAKPRTPNHDDDARSSTDALRYVCDEQEFQRVKSECAGDFFIEGIGAALKHVDDQGKHSLRHIRADRFFYDIRSRDVAFNDARFLGFIDWMDFDEAEAMWPGARDMLEVADSQTSDTTNDAPRSWFQGKQGRRRVMVVEQYFWVGDDCYRCHFTKAGDLGDGPELTGYLDEMGEHHVCPLPATSCYIDAEGNRYGIVRNLRSPQDALNKRESKSLHLLNSQSVIAEKGVIPDPEEFMDELAKPDGFAEVAEGGLVGPDGRPRVQINRHTDLAATHFQFAQQSRQDINGIGPSASNLPELPKDASGRAQAMRRKAAALDYGTIFDHLRFWSKKIFELDWLCVKWTWTREKWLRVTDDREETGYRWVGLNRQTTRGQRFEELLQAQPPIPPEKALKTAAGDKAPIIMAQAQQQLQMMAMQAQQMGQPAPRPDPKMLVQAIMANPLMLEPLTVNDVAQMQVDVILDEAPDTANLQEEQFATLSEMFGLLAQAKPDIAPVLARMMVQASTFPGAEKRELLAAFDKAPDPQVMALQQKNQQLELGLKAAQVALSQSQAQLNQAKTQSELASIGQSAEGAAPSPHDQAKLQREQVGTQLDVAKANAQIQKDQALTQKHHMDMHINAAKAQRDAMKPDVEVVEVGR
jgi:hypothetical protein